jgi:transcriptional regulator with XRE-family HTH domain
MTISKNITKLREEHNMTKQEFCDLVGINRRTLERWEKGDRNPDLHSVRAIIDKFYITDVYTFMFGKRYEKGARLTDVKPIKQKAAKKAPVVHKTIPKLMYIP